MKSDGPDVPTDTAAALTGTAAALTIKLPQFWSHSPKLWFAQCEAQFALRQVSSSLTKFYYVIAALPDDIAGDIDDLLTPESTRPYECLKAKLLRRFSESQDERLQKLLHATPRPDQKPSQLLREMRRLVDNTEEQQGSLFRRLFFDRLPVNVQLLLKAGPLTDLDEIAEKADELIALGEHATVSAVGTHVDANELQLLREQLSRLEASVPEARGRTGSALVADKRTTGASITVNLEPPLVIAGRPARFRETTKPETNGGRRFLVDTGSEVSVLPRPPRHRIQPSTLLLFAANGSQIRTYGSTTFSVDFGADFLRHFKLLVDMRHNRLIDATNFTVSRKGDSNPAHIIILR
uniref:Peptidase A2 domain-containing protein n=1 Tax=Trichuris muris TaxID=70415 RepID=A0A5S6Q1H9_TRIMR